MNIHQSRVILAEKYAHMMGGVYRLLENEAKTVLMVSDMMSLYHALENHHPDVMVVDHALSDSRDTNIAWALKKDFPEIKIIILSLHDEKSVIDDVMASGVEGYVLKRRAVIDLIPALHEVLDGRKYISPDMNEAQ
ncbi:MAG: response regulator [Desulfatirhabdiaceae bacterium]